MNSNKPRNSNIIASSILVIILALGAAMLLLVAFIIWLSELIGSICISLLLTSVALGVAAWVIYRISLADTLRRLRIEYQEVIMIVAQIRRVRDCAAERLAQLLSLLK